MSCCGKPIYNFQVSSQIFLVALAVFALTGFSVNADIVFQDDFESYDVRDPSLFEIGGITPNPAPWTPTNSAAGTTRIFTTGNYGGTKLWICSLSSDTTITSRAITVESDTFYEFKAALIDETSDASRHNDAAYDICLGVDAASAVSITGGPIAVVTSGDDSGGAGNDTYDEQYTTDSFTTGTIGPNDKLFIVITHIPTGDAWFGVDNVSLRTPTPIEIVESDGSTQVSEAGLEDSYEIRVFGVGADDVEVIITPDAQLDLGAGAGLAITAVFTQGGSDRCTVNVTAVDDEVDEGYHTALISHTVISDDPTYTADAVDDVSVSIEDNDLDFGDSNTGDINGDCRVDLLDLLTMASNWLDDTCTEPSCGDLDGIAGVKLPDFTILADNWLKDYPVLIISEFMASNNETLLDGNGSSSDWIEIYNQSSTTIALDGWYLTDDSTNLVKWQFPSGVSLDPGNYLIVFASGKTQQDFPDNYPYIDTTGYLHTNFALAADGEYLALVKPDGVTITSEFEQGGLDYPEQFGDISFGLEEFNDNGVYFTLPTPGTVNGQGFAGFVNKPKMSVPHGFYQNQFDLTITSTTEDASIYYTMDGSEPDESTATLYVAPIAVTTTTVIRAIAVKPGYGDSEIVTQSYLFLQDVLSQTGAGLPVDYRWDYLMDQDIVNDIRYDDLINDLKSIPTVSLALPAENMWGPAGIFANPLNTDLESKASIELILSDGSDGFQENGGLKIHGGGSRAKTYGKKSMRFVFRDEYGTGKLKYPFFGEDAIDTINNIVLRGNYFDTWSYCCYQSSDYIGYNNALYCRDNFARVTHNDMGARALKGYFVHVYVNGIYWGVHDATERPDEQYCADYFGGQPEDYDVLKHRVEVVSGNRTAWDELMTLITGDVASPELYAQISQRVDIYDFIDYVLLNIWGGNLDWPHNNWYVYRNRAENGPFRFVEWDAESFLFVLSTNRTGVNNSNTPGIIYSRLRLNEDFRMQFADHIHRHMFNGGALTVEESLARFIAITNGMRPALNAEAARWGDTRDYWESTTNPPLNTIDTWEPVVTNKIDSYIPQRSPLVLDQLRAANLYPEVDAPVFNVNGSYQHGGYIDSNDLLEITSSISSGGSYIEVELVAEGAPVRAHVPTDNSLGQTWTNIGFVPDSSWTDATTTGVGYDTGTDYDSWINTDMYSEMYNISQSVLCRIEFDHDISLNIENLNLYMKYDDGFVAYLNGTEICRSSTVTNDVPGTAAATNHEAQAIAVIFDVTSHVDLLQNGTNVLAIHGINATTTSSDIIVLPRMTGEYFDQQPGQFPIYYTLDGSDPRQPGGSVNPAAVNDSSAFTLDHSTHVKSRVLDGGVWSALNAAPFAVGDVAGSLRISEIMYHPQGDPNSEFIELKNIGTESINLNLVKFTNGVDFTFPSIDLAPDDYVIVVKNTAAFNTQYPAFAGTIAGQFTGALDNDGDRLRIEDAIGTAIHDFKFRDGWYDITDGDGFTLTVIDPTDPTIYGEKDTWRASTNKLGSPGASDIGPAPGDIVINELLAHSDAWPNDWIELYNASGSEINISGWYLSDNNSDDPNLMKYRIADGTTIAADSYIVFTQDEHFGNQSDSGCLISFALSENGEKACLTSAAGDVLTGLRESESFGASEVGVSLGRYYKASTDSYNFVAMSITTSGAANAYPKVGPIVISEIMYNPPAGGSYDNEEYEFIEIYNISGQTVTLEEFDSKLNITIAWKFTDGIDYTFPLGTTIGAGQRLVIARNLAAYAQRYGSSDGVLGPFENDTKLSNAGERLQLAKPGDTDANNIRQYIRIDRVTYSDGSHPVGTDPWPTEADGNGKSLTRKVLADYGNDIANWKAQ